MSKKKKKKPCILKQNKTKTKMLSIDLKHLESSRDPQEKKTKMLNFMFPNQHTKARVLKYLNLCMKLGVS